MIIPSLLSGNNWQFQQGKHYQNRQLRGTNAKQKYDYAVVRHPPETQTFLQVKGFRFFTSPRAPLRSPCQVSLACLGSFARPES